MKLQHLLLATAALGGLFTVAHPGFAQEWMQTSAPITNWSSVASSADGCKLIAAAHGGFPLDAGSIYISTNSGATWTPTTAPSTNWSAVASSADGSKLVAAGAGPIYTSVDSGATWTQTSAPISSWKVVASSADGTKLAAAGGEINAFYTSTNGGETWTRVTYGLDFGQVTTSVASSADGTRLIAGGCVCGIARPGRIYTSADSGATWTPTSVYVYSPSIATSADGNKLVAKTGYDGSIYTSTNSGATWTPTNLAVHLVASSADGKWVALDYGQMYVSTDSGGAWTEASAPSESWQAIASSADGCKIVAAAYNGGIYTWQSTPTPTLDITPSGGNVVISWIVPSTRFVLQENPDLTTTNWTDVSNTPILNLTNLQYQMTGPLPAGNRFYRLKH